MNIRSKHNQAAALVQELTLEEKTRLCSGRDFWHLEGVDRLDVPSIMVTDGPHGLRKQNQAADHVGLNKSVPATCFPTACALASTWDTELLRRVGAALGREAAAENVTVLLGPGMNIKRHPLCGRNFEYFSEDPYLTGHLAAAMIEGIQAQGVGASVKHFAVNNQEHGRMYIDAILDERTLREIYLRGFEIAVRHAQPWTVMCAYNRVNGVYCSEHDQLLNQILRDEWGFQGLVMTDWGATNERPAGLVAGVDLEMPGSGGFNDKKVEDAVRSGEIDELALDQAVTRNVSVALLGADLHATATEVDHAAHHTLAREAAVAGTVLLKNEPMVRETDTHSATPACILPLETDTHIAVIGAFAAAPRYQGTGSSQVSPTQLDNALDAFATRCPSYVYCQGYDPKLAEPDAHAIEQAVAAAQTADVAVVFAGLPALFESEGFDRTHMHLPEQHNALIEAVSAANPNTVVVLANGAAITMPWIDSVKAIVETYLPGQAGGSAIVDVLFGRANPGGKLAETFPLAQQDVLADAHFPHAADSSRQVHYREGLHVGYRYFDSVSKEVLFPFGHGLSYANIEFSGLRLSTPSCDARQPLVVTLMLENTSPVAGSEVVQAYISPLNGSVYKPEQELKGFAKLHLQPGESTEASITLEDAFSHWSMSQAQWTAEPGTYEVRVGASSRDIRLTATVEVTSQDDCSVDGHTAPDGVNDVHFELMLGRQLPPPEPIRPFHLNSSLAEISTTWFGQRFKDKVAAGFMRSMGGNSQDATLNKMFEEMANNMPIRALSLFSRGAVTPDQLEVTIALLNHQYLKALRLWWKLRGKRERTP